MLSRVANNLYWLERYLVRLHSLLNLIKANYMSNLDINDIAPWDKTVLNYTGQSIDELGLGKKNSIDMIQFLLFDKHHFNSGINLIQKARQNTRSVQEHISKEIWQNINKFYLFVNQENLSVKFFEQDPISVIDELLSFNMLHYSNEDVFQERGNAYCFMNLGKYIERLLQSIDFLLLRTTDNNRSFDVVEEHIYWKNLLITLGGYQQFVKTHKSEFEYENVIEFIVLNAFFPNSIYYCLNKIAVHVDRLNKFNQINPINNLSFCIDKLERNMRYTNIKDIQTIGLEPYLDDLKSEVYALNNEANRIYFNF
tara:strand:+ start:927 stop:1859 length:933 start_codon:yes stop_codon:yes gene_type:complete